MEVGDRLGCNLQEFANYCVLAVLPCVLLLLDAVRLIYYEFIAYLIVDGIGIVITHEYRVELIWVGR